MTIMFQEKLCLTLIQMNIMRGDHWLRIKWARQLSLNFKFSFVDIAYQEGENVPKYDVIVVRAYAVGFLVNTRFWFWVVNCYICFEPQFYGHGVNYIVNVFEQ